VEAALKRLKKWALWIFCGIFGGVGGSIDQFEKDK
jgi:hypothetical protein